jgi:hypothetical protein
LTSIISYRGKNYWRSNVGVIKNIINISKNTIKDSYMLVL